MESDYPFGWQSFSHWNPSPARTFGFPGKRPCEVWQASCLLQECNAEVGGALTDHEWESPQGSSFCEAPGRKGSLKQAALAFCDGLLAGWIP